MSRLGFYCCLFFIFGEGVRRLHKSEEVFFFFFLKKIAGQLKEINSGTK